jgi:transcriptional regulator with XRE-family HTH domain
VIDGDQFARAVGATLRQLRESRGLSLAQAAGSSRGRFSAPALGMYERGERNPSVEVLDGVARLYGMNLRSVLEAASAGART